MTILKNVVAALLCVSAVMVFSVAAEAQTYGGRSIGVTASVNNGTATNYVFADTGQLPQSGGNITISAPNSFISGVMSTGVLTASTSGALRSSQSVTVANDIDIIIGGVRIRANRATANAGCICCPGAGDGTCGGASTFNGLTITDQATGQVTNVSVTGQPNQVVNLPNGVGTLTLNEQTTGPAAITVNAIHVQAAANGTTYNIIVASASSSIECLVLSPTAADVTISGRVLDRNGRPLSATIKLTDGAGNVRTTASNTMGYFTFEEVQAGEAYVLQATARGYTFPAQTFSLEDNLTVEIRAN